MILIVKLLDLNVVKLINLDTHQPMFVELQNFLQFQALVEYILDFLINVILPILEIDGQRAKEILIVKTEIMMHAALHLEPIIKVN
tara:strand:+ start:193 stop:450 length:258 start_codon:yes stop_codon:yes gene_type:complete